VKREAGGTIERFRWSFRRSPPLL